LAAVLEIIQALVQVDRGVGARRVGEDKTENAAHFAPIRTYRPYLISEVTSGIEGRRLC
jgi:hypothetical protein